MRHEMNENEQVSMSVGFSHAGNSLPFYRCIDAAGCLLSNRKQSAPLVLICAMYLFVLNVNMHSLLDT
jgi:hypothetical protein